MDDVDVRIDSLAARLEQASAEVRAIRAELDELRGRRAKAPAAAPAPAPAPRPELDLRGKYDLDWIAGPRGLALAGGVVTLLGIAFVFALAASRGWIGPAVRCGIGGGVSALLLAAAFAVRRRYGLMAAALVAAGTGVGGAYVTLYAASRGYHLLGTPAVWAGVVCVAVIAVALALAWRSQVLAVLGLVTVVVAPPIVEDELNGIGLGVSLVAAAAALAVGQSRRWRALGGAAFGLALVQTLVYLGDAHGDWSHRGTATALAAAAFVLALAGAVAYQRVRGSRLDGFAAALAGGSLPVALVAVWALVRGDHDTTVALLVVAAAYALAAGAVRALRLGELAEALAAFALFGLALATATAFSNGGLAVAWALEGLTLVGLAARLDRRRYQAAALVYLVASGVHVFAFETPFTHLFTEEPHPAQQIGALLLLTTGVAATAFVLRGREQLVERLDLATAGIAALLALYAVSLAVMDVAQRVGGDDLHTKFQRGETVVSALWAVVALALLAVGLTRRLKEVRLAGLALLGLSLVKLFLFDLSQLSSLARAGSFLAVGLTLLAGGFLVQRFAVSRPGSARP